MADYAPVDLTTEGLAATDRHILQTETDVGVFSTDLGSDDILDIFSRADISAMTTDQREGVIVTATSVNDFETYAVAAAVSGNTAVGLGGAAYGHVLDTTATIGAGAQINQSMAALDAEFGAMTAADAQGVFVDAGRAYQSVMVGAGAAGSGSAAVAGGIALPVLLGETSAQIVGGTSATRVSAAGDVEVGAFAYSETLSIGAGLAGVPTLGLAALIALASIAAGAKLADALLAPRAAPDSRHAAQPAE